MRFIEPSGRTIRKSTSKIRFFPDARAAAFDIRAPVFGMNAIPERLQRHIALFPIESKQNRSFGRTDMPTLDAAHSHAQLLVQRKRSDSGQIGIAAPQLPFRLLCHRDIRNHAHKLDLAHRILHSTSHGMNIFTEHPASAIYTRARNPVHQPQPVNGLLHGSAIFGWVRWTINPGCFVRRSTPKI